MKGTMERPVSQGSPSELSARDSPSGSHENVDLVNPREVRNTNPTIFSAVLPLQQVASLGSLGGIPINQPNSPYGPPTFLSHIPDNQGQDNYQSIPPRMPRLSAFGGMQGSLLFPSLSSQAFGTPGYPYRNVLDAGVDYNRTWDDYFSYPLYTGFLPMPFADTLGFERQRSEFPAPRAQGSFITGVSYFGGQYSTTEGNHNLGLCDGERRGFLDSEAANWPHGASFEIRPTFDNAPVSPAVSDKTPVVGSTNPLLSPPAGMVDSSGKKQSASPDYRRKGKRTGRKFAAREQTQTVQTITPLLTRPDLHIVNQIVYQPPNVQRGWQLLPSIDFMVLEGGRKLEGINLEDALNRCLSHLDGRDELMFGDESIGNSISCRVQISGHRVSEYRVRQISTRNYRKTHGRITREKLTQDIAKLIKDYLERGETPFHVRFEDIFLTKLNHVAQASWQPELWYRVRYPASS